MSQAAKTVPTWLPDWADDSAYPARYEDWHCAQWAWAFLRRNSEYQADFARFDAILSTWPDQFAPSGETSEQRSKRLDDFLIAHMSCEYRLLRKWSLTRISDPANDRGGESFSYAASPLERLIILPPQPLGYIDPRPPPDEHHHVTLRFDLRSNIKDQLNDALDLLMVKKNRLEIQGTKAATKSREKFPLYLRVFDATLAGIKGRDIARKLIPSKAGNPKTLRSADEDIRRAIAAGAAMVNDGYKKLAIFCS